MKKENESENIKNRKILERLLIYTDAFAEFLESRKDKSLKPYTNEIRDVIEKASGFFLPK